MPFGVSSPLMRSATLLAAATESFAPAAMQAALQAGEGAGGAEPLRLRGGGRPRKRQMPPVMLPSPAADSGGLSAAAATAGVGGVTASAPCTGIARDTPAPESAEAATSEPAGPAATAEPELAAAPQRKKRRKTAASREAAVHPGAGAPDPAAAFPIGAAVEVTNDEDGLRDCW